MCFSLIKKFFMLGGLFQVSSNKSVKQILPVVSGLFKNFKTPTNNMRRRSLLLLGVLKFLNKPFTIRWYLFDAFITTNVTKEDCFFSLLLIIVGNLAWCLYLKYYILLRHHVMVISTVLCQNFFFIVQEMLLELKEKDIK